MSLSALLTPRRIRAHAFILALCLWGICAIDYSKPGLFDRVGNIKFQDFLQFPISANLIAQGRTSDLYNDQVLADRIHQIAGNTTVELKYFYGPQVALPFLALSRFSFLTQAEIWVALSLVLYSACIYLLLQICPSVISHPKLVALCSIAYPPLFHFFVRGQLSAVVLLFLTVAYLLLHCRQDLLAGVALGFLVFKPQFLVAIPIILLLAQAWKIFAGLAFSAAAQLAVTYLYFGREVMRVYFTMLLRSASHPASTELVLSAIQMHSLHSFWDLLIPWAQVAGVFYLASSIIVIGITAATWRAADSLAIRFSSLILAAVLVNPHIYIYDLLALIPVFLLLTDWSLENSNHRQTLGIRVLLYLSFLLPLFGPLARWTHLQTSVPVFAALLWTLHQTTRSRVPTKY